MESCHCRGQEITTLHNDNADQYECTELCNAGLDNFVSGGDMSMTRRDPRRVIVGLLYYAAMAQKIQLIDSGDDECAHMRRTYGRECAVCGNDGN